MLLSLHIKNYTLIDDLRLEFPPGLTVFTGETGAGKSIIIESIGLLLGERASAGTIRKGADRCFISGEFDHSSLRELSAYLEEAGLAPDKNENLIIRREIDASGKSRAFANDRPVNLATLAAIGGFLVDIHGQHEHQSLMSTAAPRQLLDRFAHAEELVKEIEVRYRTWRDLTAARDSQKLSEQERERLIDLYSFQVREIDEARLSPGEEEEINQALPRLKHAEKLTAASTEISTLLYDAEGAVLERLGRVSKLIESIQAIAGDGLAQTAETLAGAIAQLEETARDMDRFRNGLADDPAKLNEFLERLDLIHRLKRKYGATIEEMLGYRDATFRQLEALTSADRDRAELERKVCEAEQHLRTACKKLSAVREKGAGKLSGGIEKELADLGMKKARFTVTVTPLDEPGPEGIDRVEFMFSANPGEDLRPLKSIASGGELSRVMLAIKTVLTAADRVPVLIFDEIDTGIGGPMGQVVGSKLAQLGKHHQVLCITHLPQIAAWGVQHLSVAKETAEGRTLTRVRKITAAERTDEIARMLSGTDITSTARKHAAEMLRSARV